MSLLNDVLRDLEKRGASPSSSRAESPSKKQAASVEPEPVESKTTGRSRFSVSLPTIAMALIGATVIAGLLAWPEHEERMSRTPWEQTPEQPSEQLAGQSSAQAARSESSTENTPEDSNSTGVRQSDPSDRSVAEDATPLLAASTPMALPEPESAAAEASVRSYAAKEPLSPVAPAESNSARGPAPRALEVAARREDAALTQKTNQTPAQTSTAGAPATETNALFETSDTEVVAAASPQSSDSSRSQSRTRFSIQRSTPPPEEQSLVERARRALGRGRPDQASSLLGSALARDPSALQERLLLAQVFEQDGKVDSARRVLEEGLRIESANSEILSALAHLELRMRRPNRAIQILRDHAPEVAKAPELHLLWAAAERSIGRHEAALSRYREVARAHPDSGRAWLGEALSLETLNKPMDALDAYRQAEIHGEAATIDFARRRLGILVQTGSPTTGTEVDHD